MREGQDEARKDQQWNQDGPKIAPRPLQDRLGSFLASCFSFRFLIVFGSVLVPSWVPKWTPKMTPLWPWGGHWGVQGGLGVVLVRPLVRLVARVRFLGPLELLLGPFWDALGPILGLLGASVRVLWGLLGTFI